MKKILESFTCISFMKNLFKEWFCRKNFCFWKILIFKGLIDWTCFLISRSQFWNFSIGIRFLFDRSIENFPFLKSGFYQLRLMFDRCLINRNWKIFYQSIFFLCIIDDRIHMHSIVFFIHLTVLQLYLSFFSHITCIHIAKLGT